MSALVFAIIFVAIAAILASKNHTAWAIVVLMVFAVCAAFVWFVAQVMV